TENILHRNFTRRQVAIQNRVDSNIGISQSTFSVKVLNLFSRSRRKTNKRKSKRSAMLRNKETRHRMFIPFDADPKFFACLVRFESSSVPTTLPTAYDVYPLDGRHDGGYYTVKDCVTIDV